MAKTYDEVSGWVVLVVFACIAVLTTVAAAPFFHHQIGVDVRHLYACERFKPGPARNACWAPYLPH